MEQIEPHVDIAADPERIWRVLTDFHSYPEWNTFIPSIQGTPQAGQRLKVRVAPPGGRGMTFQPTVLRADPGRELRWLGRLFVPGLFDGEHSFVLEELGGGKTRLRYSERFTGLLVPLLAAQLRTSTKAGFEQMNRALQERVEKGA